MRKTILLVEDDENLGELLQTYLERYNYRVIHIRDGAEGLNAARVDEPDVIVTDLLLPGLHGIELCREIKSDPTTNHIPLIVMSGVYTAAIDKAEVKKYGVNDFLEKPVDFDTLVKVINKHTGMSGPQTDPQFVVENNQVQGAPSNQPTQPPPPAQSPRSSQPPRPTPPPQQAHQVETNRVEATPQDENDMLTGKILELEKVWSEIQQNKNNDQRMSRFHGLIADLAAGEPGNGMEELSQFARKLEQIVGAALAGGETALERKKEDIDKMLDNLRLHPLIVIGKEFKKHNMRL
ncbi:MAG: response regulator [bacterium]|nr:response regulator [bacterium]